MLHTDRDQRVEFQISGFTFPPIQSRRVPTIKKMRGRDMTNIMFILGDLKITFQSTGMSI